MVHTALVRAEIPVNEREKAFVEAYLSDPERNAARAYKAAGFQAEDASAIVLAARMLKRPSVIAAIQAFEEQHLERIRERAGISLEKTLTGVAHSAFFDVRKLFNADGSPKPITELDDATALAIEGIEVLEQFEGSGEDRVFVGYVKKYKLARRSAALDMLMKHFNAYKAHEKGKADAAVNGIAALLLEMKRSALPVVERVDNDDQTL